MYQVSQCSLSHHKNGSLFSFFIFFLRLKHVFCRQNILMGLEITRDEYHHPSIYNLQFCSQCSSNTSAVLEERLSVLTNERQDCEVCWAMKTWLKLPKLIVSNDTTRAQTEITYSQIFKYKTLNIPHMKCSVLRFNNSTCKDIND